MANVSICLAKAGRIIAKP